METNQSFNILERFNQWLKESITVKLMSIGFLILILLIPTVWIQDLMEERQERAESVIAEVSEKWSGNQTISGPILIIPYRHQETIFIDGDKNKIEIRETIRKAFFLPESLEIKGNITPEIRKRGIFEAVVYKSTLTSKTLFQKPDFTKLEIASDLVLWKDASLAIAISDLRGISDDPKITVGTQKFYAEPIQDIGISTRRFKKEIIKGNASEYDIFSQNGIIIPLNWESESSFEGNSLIVFELKGSERLSFVPSGKTTLVNLNGPWTNPSFDGEFLPAEHDITETDFSAQWKVLNFNRPFAQQWKGEGTKLTGSEFGLNLLIPVDQYQKSIRTSKYGLLIILLTFIALFLVEITQKIRIHPFQYILIGVALIIYYTLIISFSEQTGYDVAYWISTFATVSLISLYSITFFRNKRLVLLFSALLLIFYSFIFIIILQQDFSLLIGSIGLFIIVAALMYFSRKVNWYKEARG